MKKNFTSFLILSCSVFIVNGCANNEGVKKEGSEPPAVTAAVLKPAVKAEPGSAQMPKQTHSGRSVAQDIPELIPQAGELKTVLEKIYFDFDAHSLSSKARNSLVKNAEIMKKDSTVTVRIEGHCDERGSDAYNLALGEKRAKTAMKYLVTLGIPEERLSVISYGKEKPLAAGHDEAAWAQNRRDEFVIRE